jgi:hypothetical protein
MAVKRSKVFPELDESSYFSTKIIHKTGPCGLFALISSTTTANPDGRAEKA